MDSDLKGLAVNVVKDTVAGILESADLTNSLKSYGIDR